MGLSQSRVLGAEIKRSPLQWSWEAYDEGGPFPGNTYGCKILFLGPIFTNDFSLESFVWSGWSPGIEQPEAVG